MAEDYSSLRSSLLTGIPADLPSHPGLDLSVDNALIVAKYCQKNRRS